MEPENLEARFRVLHLGQRAEEVCWLSVSELHGAFPLVGMHIDWYPYHPYPLAGAAEPSLAKHLAKHLQELWLPDGSAGASREEHNGLTSMEGNPALWLQPFAACR